jgi:hypothetical protein
VANVPPFLFLASCGDAMRRPTNFEYKVVLKWQANRSLFWAWEQLQEMIKQDRLRAWRMVQVMVAYAPSGDLLAYVAAGPIEDLFGMKELMRDEAEKNARFRICLGMTYGLPPELEPFADREKEITKLPSARPIDASPEEISLMTAYFHQSDTMWASAYFEELNAKQPEEALFILRLLLESREYPDVREEVFQEAFASFVGKHLARYRTELSTVVQEHEDLRQWCVKRKSPPLCVEDIDGWTAFIRDIASSRGG